MFRHIVTLWKAQKNNVLLLVSLLSVTLCQLAPGLPNLVPQVGGRGKEEGGSQRQELKTHSRTPVECEDRFWESKHTNAQRYIHREASSVKASVGPGEHWGQAVEGLDGEGGSCFQSPEPPLLVSQCSFLEQWEQQPRRTYCFHLITSPQTKQKDSQNASTVAAGGKLNSRVRFKTSYKRLKGRQRTCFAYFSSCRTSGGGGVQTRRLKDD